MTSNILSRLLPSASDENLTGTTSRLPRYHDISDSDDRGSTELDEENLGARFQEQDLEALLADPAESRLSSTNPALDKATGKSRPAKGMNVKSWGKSGNNAGTSTDDDDDVPESLLLDRKADLPPRPSDTEGLPPPVPGPANRQARAQWDSARAQQRLHSDDSTPFGRRRRQFGVSPKEKALFMWANVMDLDSFLHEVYSYYYGHGMWSILIKELLSLV
jgi:autophagy-related protein 9